jgi:hypothetical protein
MRALLEEKLRAHLQGRARRCRKSAFGTGQTAAKAALLPQLLESYGRAGFSGQGCLFATGSARRGRLTPRCNVCARPVHAAKSMA